jgi:peptidoglycan/LPS O-acetylase OafA/YrhL
MSRNYYDTHFRIDALMFGVLLSYWFHWRHDTMMRFCRRQHHTLMITGVALLAPASFIELEGSFYYYTLGLSVNYLGSGMILAAFLTHAMPRGGAYRAMEFIGIRSYSIYLWHAPVNNWGLTWVAPILKEVTPLSVFIALGVAGPVAVGVLLACVVESPALRVRDRLFPSRSSPPTPKGTDGIPATVGGFVLGETPSRPMGMLDGSEADWECPNGRANDTAHLIGWQSDASPTGCSLPDIIPREPGEPIGIDLVQ